MAAPGAHRVVLENQTTRALEVTIAPGEREPEHTHRWPSVMVVHRPARTRYYTGETLTFTSPEQPSFAAPGPRVGWLDPEGPHSVENIDDHAYGAFLLSSSSLTAEPKGASLAAASLSMASSARALAALAGRTRLSRLPAG